MSDNETKETIGVESETRKPQSYSRNDFGWESLASVEASRQHQLISEIYSIMTTGDDEKLAFIKKEWNSLSEEGIDAQLEARFNQAVARYETRQERLEEALEAKKALIAKAETFKHSKEWNKTAVVLQNLQKEWKEAGYAGQDLDQELWEKFRAINDYFFEERGKYYDTLTLQREKAIALKEALIAEVEALKDSTDWKETSVAIRDLMTRWKEAGFAGRDHEDALWDRFNASRQHFYTNQRQHFDDLRLVHDAARDAKKKIVEDAERIMQSFNESTQRESMEALFNEWKTIGHSGRENEEKLWNQFRAVQDEFYAALKNREANRRADVVNNAENELETLTVRIGALESLNEKLSLKIQSLQHQYEANGSEVTLEELNGLKANLEENESKLKTYRADYETYEAQLQRY